MDEAERLVLVRRKARSIMRFLVRSDGMETMSGVKLRTKNKHDTPGMFEDALAFLVVMGWAVRRTARANGEYLIFVETMEAQQFLTQPISRTPAKVEYCLNTAAGVSSRIKLEHDGGEELDDGFDVEDDDPDFVAFREGLKND